MPTHTNDFDLSPHPRILPMLGEITLAPWRCLAELIDNSVDAFLSARRAGAALTHPEVSISIPTADVASAKLTLRDNAPGMTLERLENAMRAGWTGNDPINNLGMFGMGFNIATARLGTLTRVWSTIAGDGEWIGLEIDFDTLMRQRHFRTPILHRAKADPSEHGTEVSVERLKPEQRQWLTRAANLSKIRRDLAQAYSAMLRSNGVPIAFGLMINGQAVRSRDHCVWGDGPDERIVHTNRYGPINAFQRVDVRLDDRLFCTRCWQWLAAQEESCPACNTTEGVVSRTRHVHGWLGIQRYVSATEYGIDLIRHGRKIEYASRDLFKWTGDTSVEEEEYPIDDPRHRGRIVGEIHIDHCRVTYTKDRFDRNDPAWEEMVSIVRGEGPLRPDKAAGLGFGQNNSPLSLLFQAFRRSTPKPKAAGCYARLLIVPDNERAEEMAKRFYAADPEYRTDVKWWELVQEADRELLQSQQQPGGGTGGIPGLVGGPSEDDQAQPPEPPVPAPTPPPARTPLQALSREYRDEVTNQRWEVQAFAVEASDPILSEHSVPWLLRATAAGVHEFYVDAQHVIFDSATMTPLDGLLAELSWAAMDFIRGTNTQARFAGILAGLRDRYATATKLDEIALSADAVSTLSDIARAVANALSSADSASLFEELPLADREAILQKMASRAVSEPQRVLAQGRFLEFAPRRALLTFFQKHPELFFDGNYWDEQYAGLDFGSASATEEARARLVAYYFTLLADAAWLAENEPADLADASRVRLLRAALALDLLAPTSPAISTT
ncbi:MAG: ATP-binding protein [Verrucomicrobia bacterium]|nr:MAG: ATP-binding protein [Verrucomicrobiota bacterium]